MSWFSISRFLTLASIAPVGAWAALDVASLPKDQLVEIPVPGKTSEKCMLPRHLEGAKYSKKDLKHEQALCALNTHAQTAVCPKLESTNPGLNFFEVPQGATKQQVEAKECEKFKVGTTEFDPKKLAKFNLSTSCSYAPSLLTYYHLSRILGGIADVPVAVLRTFDREAHQKHAKAAFDAMRAKGILDNPNEIIDDTWKSLDTRIRNGHPDVVTADQAQTYGALQKNVSHEFVYKELFNWGGDQVVRTANFRDKNPAYKDLTTLAAVDRIVGTEFNQANVQRFVRMRDVSEMILKDNDCGITKTNHLKSAGLLARVAHLNPKTYKRLLQLSSMIGTPEFADFMSKELTLSKSDISKIKANLAEMVKTLQSNCRSGALKLDLEAHFSGKNIGPVSCD